MKKIIYIILFLLISGNAEVYSQTGRFSISQTNDGSVIDVSIYVRSDAGPAWSIGFASFVFYYNNLAMTNPVEISESVWDDSANTEYADQYTVFYDDGNSVSVEIGLDTLPSAGTLVPGDSTLVGTIRFDILDHLATHQIRWNLQYCAVLDNNGIDITSGMIFSDPENVLLPVELTSFYFNKNKNNIDLIWTTASEINNDGFDIERKKSDGQSGEWNYAGFAAGNGNTNEYSEYNFKDKNLSPGKYLYRLKQKDFNGNFEYHYLSGEVTVEIPVKNFLSQNYPNPFNPNSLISYEITSQSSAFVNVRLSVYNTLGKEMAVLVNQKQSAGYYKMNFNGADFPSGVYVYILQTDGKIIESKRMMLIK